MVISNAKGKTPGADRISYDMIKHSSSLTKTRIVDLYNSILNQGIFPYFLENFPSNTNYKTK